MPFLIFRSKVEHNKALDVVANIYRANEQLPLEKRITGIVSSFAGLDDNAYSQVYFFHWRFLYAFEEAKIRYALLDNKEIFKFLSTEGKQQFIYAWKTRPQHLIDADAASRKS